MYLIKNFFGNLHLKKSATKNEYSGQLNKDYFVHCCYKLQYLHIYYNKNETIHERKIALWLIRLELV